MSININYQESDNEAFYYGDMTSPYVVINQGTTYLFFSDASYDRFLGTIA